MSLPSSSEKADMGAVDASGLLCLLDKHRAVVGSTGHQHSLVFRCALRAQARDPLWNEAFMPQDR